MSADLAELQFVLDGSGVERELRKVETASGRAADAVEKFENSGTKATGALGKLEKAAGGFITALGLSKIVGIVSEVTQLAARYETLGIVMGRVGQNIGASSTGLLGLEQTLRKVGISAIESRSAIINMIQAGIDLKNAPQLARIAQNAAVIGGVNSSEAFQRVVYGLKTAQPEILRTLGLNVNFERSYAALAATLGKHATQLSETEKSQARLNTVVQAGTAISGAYESALGTAGKQLASSQRYLEDAKVAAGEAFQPAFTVGVGLYADALKLLAQNAKTVSAVLVGLGAALAVLTIPAGLALLGTAVGGGVAALAALTAIVGGSLFYAFEKSSGGAKTFDDQIGTLTTRVGLLRGEIEALGALTRESDTSFFGLGKYFNKDQLYTNRQSKAASMTADADFQQRSILQKLQWHKLLIDLNAGDPSGLGTPVDTGAGASGVVKKHRDEVQAIIDKLLEEKATLTASADAWQVYDAAVHGATDRQLKFIVSLQETVKAKKDADDLVKQILGPSGNIAPSIITNNPYDPTTKLPSKIDPTTLDSSAYDKGLAAYQAAQKQAQKWTEGYRQVLENFQREVQQSFASFFQNIFLNGVQSFRGLFDQVFQLFIRMLAQIAAAKLVQSLQGPIGALLGVGISAAGGSVGGGASAPIGSALSGGTNVGSLGLLTINQTHNWNVVASDSKSFGDQLEAHTDTLVGIVGTAVTDGVGASRLIRGR